MWRRVDLVWNDVSEESIASIFRVEKFANEKQAWAGGCRLLSVLQKMDVSVILHINMTYRHVSVIVMSKYGNKK
jgi:hypothetical protein